MASKKVCGKRKGQVPKLINTPCKSNFAEAYVLFENKHSEI